MKTILMTLLVITASLTLAGFTKNEITRTVEETEKKIMSVDARSDLKPYMPHEEYSESLLFVIKSKQYIADNDLPNASYFARAAMLRITAAEVSAQARKLRYERLIDDIAFLKTGTGSRVNSGENWVLLLAAAFRLKEKDFYRVYFDSEIYKPKSYQFTDRGVHELKEVIGLLKAFPDAKLMIVGHTTEFDYRNSSEEKARIIQKFFLESGVAPERISVAGLGNQEPVMTPAGYRKIGRIELILKEIPVTVPQK